MPQLNYFNVQLIFELTFLQFLSNAYLRGVRFPQGFDVVHSVILKNIYIQKVEYKHVNSGKMRSEGWNNNKTIKPSTSKFAGHNRSLSLRQVLRRWDVPARDLGLLRRGRGQLFVLHFCLGHIVVTRVKVLLLEKG